MKPYRDLAETRSPDGTVFSLHEHDGYFYLRNDGRDLMGTANTYSEELLADIGCEWAERPEHPRVLIGGLGLGFSLKRVLEIVGSPATVQVAEIIPEVIEWNRTFLAERNAPLLADERTSLYEGDVYDCMVKAGKSAYDVILLDVDDTPKSLVLPKNRRIYSRNGLQVVYNALAPGGRVAFWLAESTPSFLRHLKMAGFLTTEFPAKKHERAKRAHHRIYLGVK